MCYSKGRRNPLRPPARPHRLPFRGLRGLRDLEDGRGRPQAPFPPAPRVQTNASRPRPWPSSAPSPSSPPRPSAPWSAPSRAGMASGPTRPSRTRSPPAGRVSSSTGRRSELFRPAYCSLQPRHRPVLLVLTRHRGCQTAPTGTRPASPPNKKTLPFVCLRLASASTFPIRLTPISTENRDEEVPLGHDLLLPGAATDVCQRLPTGANGCQQPAVLTTANIPGNSFLVFLRPAYRSFQHRHRPVLLVLTRHRGCRH